MKRTLLSLCAVSALAAAFPGLASAQTWQTISQRQISFNQRVEIGVRNGGLNRIEAERLRADYAGLVNLERQYRASTPGLTQAEVQDLDRRFNMISNQIQSSQVGYNNQTAWQTMAQRQTMFYQRLDTGLRNNSLTRGDADRMRADFNMLINLENQYRASRPGLTQAELEDLDRRYNTLAQRLTLALNDDGRGKNGRGNNGRGGGDGDARNMDVRRAQLDQQIDRALANRRLTTIAAQGLHRETAALVRLQSQYRASAPGITRAEHAELDRRADAIEVRIPDRRAVNNGRDYDGAPYPNGNGYGGGRG